jgi:predicted metalloprotease with PDZ domain
MKIHRQLLALLLIILPGACWATDSAGSDNSHYEITIPVDDHRIALVRASLLPDGQKFFMFPGANQLPERWATFVSNLAVHDANGETIAIVANGDGSWSMSQPQAGRLTLSYQVNLEHEAHAWSGGIDGAAYSTDWGVFYTARALFVVNGEERQDITVDFQLPEQWRVTTSWQERADDGLQFTVSGYDELATSMLFAGTHLEVTVEQGPFEFLLALGGPEILALEADFVALAEGVLDYYVSLMGDVPRLPSQASGGKPVVIINQAQMTDGEAIGNNISILLEPMGDPMAQHIARFIFAHEFFHLWNGKSFMPEQDDAEWLKEGFSNYYTLKALRHIGYLDDESYLQLLAGFFYQRYAADDAVGRLSITNGHLKHDHWGLIYSGGLMVAIAQDLQIRSASGNEQSLDDLMRYLFNEHNDTAYTLGDIERVLSELNRASQAEFFRRYIYGVEKIPVADFLKLAGIETVTEAGETAYVLLDISDPETLKNRRGLLGRQ